MIKMKKIITSFALFLAMSASLLFADVSGRRLPDGKVEVTFFYGNPRATEVLVAGDFTKWQAEALPMTKTDKGFTCTKVFEKDVEDITYKFISDGNWTTDLRAPLAIDDGFGGKNSKAVLAELAGGDESAGGAKIAFSTWTLAGTQAQFATGKGDDAYLDNVTTAFKSYNKFGGNFLPNSPFFIELALSENELEGTNWGAWNVANFTAHPEWGAGVGNASESDKKNHYLYKANKDNHDGVSFGNAMQNYLNGILTNPVSYLANSTMNAEENNGPGSNPFLGHLKFGWNTPYVNYVTGFNYAKPETNKTILWTTVDGAWDAGYEHHGGFAAFSLGEKLTKVGDGTLNFTFAPNKSADRKGNYYGLWSFANYTLDNFVVEAQYNGYYLGDGLFYKPWEQDVILGAKNKFGNVSVAAQFASTFYNNYNTAKNLAGGTSWGNWASFSGYSSSVLAFKEDSKGKIATFDFAKRTMGELNIAYTSDVIDLSVDYRYRGAESNLLFVTDHHTTVGNQTKTDEHGKANTQRWTLDANIRPVDTVSIQFTPYFETVFNTKDFDLYNTALKSQYESWWTNNDRTAFANKDGKRFGAYEKIDLNLEDAIGQTSSLSIYGEEEFVTEKEDKFAGYDSKDRFNKAGAKFSIGDLGDTLESFDLYWGMDNTNDDLVLNTVIGSLNFANNARVDIFCGIRSMTPEYNDEAGSVNNHPFGFGAGVSKTLKKALKKPTLYAQFVYDMDPYNAFGSGQDGLRLDGYCTGNQVIYNGNGDTAECDAVNYYRGAASVRAGIRWSL